MGQLAELGLPISRIDAEELSCDTFRTNFMLANQPLIVSGATDLWQATRDWIDADGRPNLSFLSDNFGESIVQVADCSQQRFSDQERLTMTVREYVEYCQRHIALRDTLENASPSDHGPTSVPKSASATSTDRPICSFSAETDPHVDSHPASKHGAPTENGDAEGVTSDRSAQRGLMRDSAGKGLEEQQQRRLLYLKDWHFVAEYPRYHAYETPVYFKDDWLNEYLDRHPMQYEPPASSLTHSIESEEVFDCDAEPCTLNRDLAPLNLPHVPASVSNDILESGPKAANERLFRKAEHSLLETLNPAVDSPTLATPSSPSNSAPHQPFTEPKDNGLESARTGSEPVHTEAPGPLPGAECADYRFLYMGPAGSWTPCHADVLRSYSWSANVCGRKRWRLLPPEQAWMLFDRHGRSTVYDIDGPVDPAQFPHFNQTRWLECTQEAGEAIFVPSGWFHQVTNLEDTISINHNWLNGYNLHWAWALLQDDYQATVDSIEDCREMSSPEEFEALCQRNLQLNSGTNFSDFFAFVGTMALDKARKLRSLTGGPSPSADAAAGSGSEDAASEIRALHCACRVLQELGDQNLYKARYEKKERETITESFIESRLDCERVLGLPRDSALACGPQALAQALQSLINRVQEAMEPCTGTHPSEVVHWRK